MYRANETAFLVPNGHDNLPIEIKALLYDAGASRADRCPDYDADPNYNGENVVWVEREKIDGLCQNSDFWNALLNEELVPFRRFKAKVLIEYADSGILSNDNTKVISLVDEDWIFGESDIYVSNSEYQNNYVLTPDFIDTIPDIKQWIRDREIDGEFDLRKSDDTLKEGVKNYYNLIGEI